MTLLAKMTLMSEEEEEEEEGMTSVEVSTSDIMATTEKFLFEGGGAREGYTYGTGQYSVYF